MALRWDPDVVCPLVNPTHIQLDSAGSQVSLSPGQDAYLHKPSNGQIVAGGNGNRTALGITGGRNVQIESGLVIVDSRGGTTTQKYGVEWRQAEGVISTVGLDLQTGQAQDGDGITVSGKAPKGTSRAGWTYPKQYHQYIRHDGYQWSGGGVHPDFIQKQGPGGPIFIDHATVRVRYQGLEFASQSFSDGPTPQEQYTEGFKPFNVPSELRNINLLGVPPHASGYLAWFGWLAGLSSGFTGEDPSQFILENFYVDHWNAAYQLGRNLVWPRDDTVGAGGEDINLDVVGGTTATYPSTAFITGTIKKGSPPGGDYAPSSAVGANYNAGSTGGPTMAYLDFIAAKTDVYIPMGEAPTNGGVLDDARNVQDLAFPNPTSLTQTPDAPVPAQSSVKGVRFPNAQIAGPARIGGATNVIFQRGSATRPATVFVRARRVTTPAGGFATLASIGDPTNGITIYYNKASGQMSINYRNAAATINLDASTGWTFPDDGQYHWVGFIWNGVTAQAFADGLFRGAAITPATAYGDTVPTAVARPGTWGTAQHWEGDMGAFGFSTTAWVAQDVADLQTTGAVPDEVPAVAGSGSYGFRRTADGKIAWTATTTGATWQSGFLRSPDGVIVATTDATGATYNNGFIRAPSGALVLSGTPRKSTPALYDFA